MSGTHLAPSAPIASSPHLAPSAHVPHVTDAMGGAATGGALGGAVGDVVRPVGELVRPVVGTVVRPVGDLVESVTGGLSISPGGVPSVPGLPVLPELPAPPSPPVLPGAGAGTPSATGNRQPVSGVAERPGATRGGSHAVLRSDAPGGAVPAGPDGFGAGGGAVVVRRVLDVVRGVVQVGRAPARQTPPGDLSGALGNPSAADVTAPRHGDAHAVAPNHRAPLRLAPGASAVATATETRDRYRDIPVFPG
ncbi:hypothetical protein ABZX90_21460 [Streptomyces sp. NPDC002935]|uniref:hypothetical protein n=1 Tax=Streptomyces sp. NPDC002935 TaxID=3154545 RepID=UPI0033BDD1F8